MTVEPGNIYTKNGFDFVVQFVEKDTAYGLKYRSEDRGIGNFADTDKYRENLRIKTDELLRAGGELVTK